MDKPKSISDFIKDYFKNHPKTDIEHGPVVDWVEEQYLQTYGKKPRDTWRAIRKLSEEGFLIKVRKGVYRYDPDYVQNIQLEDFTPEQKKLILEKDNYKCVICGKGVNEGVELHVDHIKPKSLGGTSAIENGQTLCAQHNFIKKNFGQTETGKKMFIHLYKLAKIENNKQLEQFCKEIFEVYEKYGINGHIKWTE